MEYLLRKFHLLNPFWRLTLISEASKVGLYSKQKLINENLFE